WLGGRLELSGVFGGCPSLASSRATRSLSSVFSAISALIRSINARISASLPALSRDFRSGGSITRPSSQIRASMGIPFMRPESFRHRVSNYLRYGGNGITYGGLAADIIGAALLGRSNASA